MMKKSMQGLEGELGAFIREKLLGYGQRHLMSQQEKIARVARRVAAGADAGS